MSGELIPDLRLDRLSWSVVLFGPHQSNMRVRFKGPLGTGILELDDHATIQMIFEALKQKTLIENFTIKYGPPVAMHTISMDQAGLEAKALGLNGQTLTIVPASVELNRANSTQKKNTDLPREPSSGRGDSGEIVVAWPEREGSLCKSCI